MRFQFPNNWHLTPSLGASYQHQWVNGYKEHGNGAVSVASEQADALRLKAQLELAQDYQTNDAVITPHLRLGVRQQYNFGGAADGAFANGTDFSLELKDGSRTAGLAGVGVQVAFNNGLATYVEYDGALASGRTVHAVTGGLRYSW
jgi:outer membrane autotransporter protein